MMCSYLSGVVPAQAGTHTPQQNCVSRQSRTTALGGLRGDNNNFGRGFSLQIVA
jgi:hypothetical protein